MRCPHSIGMLEGMTRKRTSTTSLAAATKQSKPAVTRVSSTAPGKSSVAASRSSRNETQGAAKESKPRKLKQSDFESALEALRQRELQPDPPDSDDEIEPVVVCREVSQGEVLRFREKHEKLGFRIRFYPSGEYGPDTDPDEIMGKLIATELPSSPHEFPGPFIQDEIKFGVFTKYGVRSLQSSGSQTCTTPGYGVKEPDSAVTPKGLTVGLNAFDLGDGNPFPTFVIEIAYRESLNRLTDELMAWISGSTSVMVAIGVKIYGLRTGGARRMLALVYRRGVPNPEQAVEFGTTVPTAAGLQLVIQVADLYHGVACPPGYVAGDTVTIDLAMLQDIILSKIM